MFLMADMMTWAEVGESLCRKAATGDVKPRSPEFMKASARLFAAEVAEKVFINGLKIAKGYDHDMEDVVVKLQGINFGEAVNSCLQDMDRIAEELVK